MGKDKKEKISDEEEEEESSQVDEKIEEEDGSEQEDEDENSDQESSSDDDGEEDDEYDEGEETKNQKRKASKNNLKKEEGDNTQNKKVKAEDVEDAEEDDGIKWKYLEHKGVLFPDYWKKHNVRITYDRQPLDLTIKQEEMATYWAQTLGTDYEQREIYRKNFIVQWKKTFKNKSDYPDFEKFDFMPIKNYLEEEKQKRKERTKEEKLELKNQQAAKDKIYGYAIVDHDKERIGGYLVEPPTLFKGRGEHPKAGLMKARIVPEQYTVNISEDAPVPKCMTPGHCWMEIVHKQDVSWLGGYKDDTINPLHKYTQMAATSKFKYLNDIKKYDRARRLKNMVDKIRADYDGKMANSRARERQLGTAAYLIDFLALRVGNEKGEDEADTVGCCSLRVEHITLPEDGQVTFDFLGKDSMRYHNTVTVKQSAWLNIKEFMKGKKPDTDLFDQISAGVMNDYLKTFMPDLSAKVFRTYNASHTLQQQLDKGYEQNIISWTTEQKNDFYENAVKQVAILCNHQKTVSKSFNAGLEKQQERINIYQTYKEELEAHIKKFKGNKAVKKVEKEVILEKKDDGNHKMFTKKFPESKDKAQAELKKINDKINTEQRLLEKKEGNKDIALGTSKTNYNDPRVTVAWCKNADQPIEKCFPKTLRDKFLWAMKVEPEYKF